MPDYMWGIFIVCLVAGIIFLIRGLFLHSNPFASLKSFFIAGLSFLVPVVVQFIRDISEGNFEDIPAGFLFVLVILIIFHFFSRFVINDDYAGRKATLISSILLLIQLLFVMGGWFVLLSLLGPIAI